MKTSLIRKNGNFIPWDDAKDHHLTHSLHYGGGVFEGIRCYDTADGPKIFRLKEHIDRLLYSAKVMHITIPFTSQEIMDATLELVRKNGIKEGYIRPIVYLGEGNMSLKIYGMKPEVMISVWKREKYLGDESISVKIASIRRMHPETTDMKAKITGSYANSLMAGAQVHAAGFDESLLLDTQGYIAEGPGENIFFIKGNTIVTPQEGTILPGITRNSIIQITEKELGIKVQEMKIMPADLDNYDEAFFVGTATEVTAIESITDETGKTYQFSSDDENTVTQKLKILYQKIIHGKDEKYKHRLH